MIHITFWIIFGALVGWVAAILDNDASVQLRLRTLAFVITGTLGGLAGGLAGLALAHNIDNYDAEAGGLLFALAGAVSLVIVARIASDRSSQ